VPFAIDESSSTRERIIGAALGLFVERGYRATTVGEIEAAAGLTPRAGALYKHFASKQEVLEAALDRHVSAVEAVRSVMDFLPLGDLRAELTLLARWTLQELAKEYDLCRILEHEGREFPELLRRMKDAVVQRAYRDAAEFIRRRLDGLGLPQQDCEALAAIALGALVNYRAEERLFGEPPAGVDEERFVKTWVDLWAAFAVAARDPVPERSQAAEPPPASVDASCSRRARRARVDEGTVEHGSRPPGERP
jgi:AcrR family transcriptional regulator